MKNTGCINCIHHYKRSYFDFDRCKADMEPAVEDVINGGIRISAYARASCLAKNKNFMCKEWEKKMIMRN